LLLCELIDEWSTFGLCVLTLVWIITVSQKC
jgi:hypothetical protein